MQKEDEHASIRRKMKHTASQPSWPLIITLLSNLVVFHKYTFEEFVKKLIIIVEDIVSAESCFIYIHDRKRKLLTLVASKNPHKPELGEIHLAEGEGITGWVAQHRQPVAIDEKAYLDSRFKYFQELPEDKYESFLSIPILDESGVVGVMNFQNNKPYTFSEEQITVLESIGKIVASAFVNSALDEKILSLEEKLEERKIIEKAKGILMKARKLTEEEAFRVIRKEAMNKRKSLKEIAEAILLVWPS